MRLVLAGVLAASLLLAGCTVDEGVSKTLGDLDMTEEEFESLDCAGKAAVFLKSADNMEESKHEQSALLYSIAYSNLALLEEC